MVEDAPPDVAAEDEPERITCKLMVKATVVPVLNERAVPVIVTGEGGYSAGTLICREEKSWLATIHDTTGLAVKLPERGSSWIWRSWRMSTLTFWPCETARLVMMGPATGLVLVDP